VARSPSSRAGAAFERLQALIAAAETAELSTDPVEATAHLRVLLFARTTSERAREAWQSLRARCWAPLYAVLADPSIPASAWTFTPRDAAVLFDLLATLSDRGETSLRDLDRSFETIVDAARLQLVAPPSGYWQDGSSSAPAHVAPVFGRVASLHGLQRRPARVSDGQSGDLLLFTVDLTVPVRLGPIRSLLIDCPQGLSYVPGSARYENEFGEWVRLAVPRFGPLRFEIPRLDRVARIEYLMWRTDDAWANWIDGEWIDASGRSLPWDS